MRRVVVATGFAAFLAWGGPATAQAVSDNVAAVEGFPLPLGLPPPADTGKPSLFVPPPLTSPPAGCAAAFDCRVRVIGAIQRNGAVVLDTSVLRW
jgi:hypothetical protein